MKERYRYKSDRVSAYILDLLLVTILVTFLMQNAITNPFFNNTKEAQKEYVAVYKEEMAENKLSNSNEVDKFIKKVSPAYRTYNIRNSFALSLWTVIITLFYFGLFAWFNDGQTLGKKISKLKVVNNSDGKSASLFQLCFRNIFGGNAFLGGCNTIILINMFLPLIKNSYVYMVISVSLTSFAYFIDIVFLLLFVIKKNGRTLDDLVGRTKVIRFDKKSVSNKE